MRTNKTFICPVCNGLVSVSALACPHCGADERSGWSDRTYLDGIDVGDEIDYDELVRNEFPSSAKQQKRGLGLTAIIGAILLAAFTLGLVKILW